MRVIAAYKGKRYHKKWITAHLNKIEKIVHECLKEYNAKPIHEYEDPSFIMSLSSDDEKSDKPPVEKVIKDDSARYWMDDAYFYISR
jgi:hypothetical protein